LDARTRYTFEVILPTGEPKLPKKVADTFKKKYGVLVRDHVPISVREWNKRKGADDSDYVAEQYKENLWNDLMAHFNLPKCENEDAIRQLRAKVKQWTLNKMAEPVPGVEEKIMEKLSEDKESASIQRVSSEAGESLEGISGVQGVRRCQDIIRKEQKKCRQEEISPKAGARGLRDCHLKVG
jgi:hypothetical protein